MADRLHLDYTLQYSASYFAAVDQMLFHFSEGNYMVQLLGFDPFSNY